MRFEAGEEFSSSLHVTLQSVIPCVVIPAKAGIHLADNSLGGEMDSGFRRNDAKTRRGTPNRAGRSPVGRDALLLSRPTVACGLASSPPRRAPPHSGCSA